MKKRLMLILAIGVCFTSVCFAAEGNNEWGSDAVTGQITSNSQIGPGSDCGFLDQDDAGSSSSSTGTTNTGKGATPGN